MRPIGGLVDGERSSHRLRPLDRAVGAGRIGDETERAAERRVEHLAHQRRLARAADAGDHAHATDGDAEAHVLQVVLARSGDLEEGRRRRTMRAHHPSGLAQGLRRRRRRVGEDDAGGAFDHDVSAAPSTARPHVDDVVGGADGLGVVLDDQHGAAGVHQRAQVVEERLRVARVQTDGRLVEYVERAGETAAELRREPQTLHLAAGEGAGSAIEREVAEPDVVGEAHAAQELGVRSGGDRGRVAGELPGLRDGQRRLHAAPGEGRIGLAGDANCPRNR